MAIKVGLGVSVVRLDERKQLIAQSDIFSAAFAGWFEAIGKLQPGRAGLCTIDYPLQGLKAAVRRDRAGDEAIAVEAGPKLRLRARCEGARDDLFEIVIALADCDAALDLKAQTIAGAGSVAIDDDIVHRLALPLLLHRHTRHIPRLSEGGFFSK